jgi:hypothetical protein
MKKLFLGLLLALACSFTTPTLANNNLYLPAHNVHALSSVSTPGLVIMTEYNHSVIAAPICQNDAGFPAITSNPLKCSDYAKAPCYTYIFIPVLTCATEIPISAPGSNELHYMPPVLLYI